MQDFAAKRNALFACLDDAASKELKGTALEQSGPDRRTLTALRRASTNDDGSGAEIMVYRRGGNRSEASSTAARYLANRRGKESIFKKPELPIGKCLKPRKTPDYQMNPHKWKKYSLSDVDISDHTNTSAAFTFLRQIDEQREEQATLQDDTTAAADTETKIEFKKSSKIRRHLKAIEAAEVPDAEVDKPKLKGSKLMMPEYVIGQRNERKKKPLVGSGAGRVEKTVRAAGALTLAHLQEDEEEEDEDE